MLKLDRQFGLYVIRKSLAVNAMKACCMAEDPFFDRDVALKLVTPAAVGSRENLNLLDLYLESTSGLEHPAISPLYDNGIEEDACYFTTTFYTGGSLADQLSEPVDTAKGMRIILQLCSGLAYAYSEGFEHGKLLLKDIFLSSNGDAVISDFGLAATLEGLNHNREQSGALAPQGLSVETLQSLGEILIKLLLGSDAQPVAESLAALRQSQPEPVSCLATDLLGVGEREITSFDDLLERLTDLSDLGSAAGIDEYIEYVEQTQTPPSGGNPKGLKLAGTPSQRQREKKETAYAKSEIRRLVAEKSKLQDALLRADADKKQTEIRLESETAALKAAQKAEISATDEIKMVTVQTTGPGKTHLSSGLWMLGGLLVGALLTSGYNYYYLAPAQEQLQTQKAPTQSAPSPASAPMSPLPTIARRQEASAPKVTVSTTPPQAEAERWWPAGGEFDPSTEQETMQAPSASSRQEVLTLVQNWARAWSNQDQKKYFTYYSTKYQPEAGRTRKEWRTLRLSRLTGPLWIKVILYDPQLRSISKDRIQIVLKQNYSSDSYKDQILKSLDLVKENDQWRILTERSL